MITSAYVHIPFCTRICSYCSFYRFVYQPAKAQNWLQALIQEAQERLAAEHPVLTTLYFGGGTPNVLPLTDFKALAETFRPYLAADYEWTVECNPELLDEAWVKLFAELGINRISLGVQTFQDELKGVIRRVHTNEQVRNAVALLKRYGITNISLDLIYALPNETLAQVEADLQEFLALDCPHISIYSLQIEEDSLFGRQGLEPLDEDLEADMFEKIVLVLKQAGYEHYEISSFARSQAYSRHNLAYWQDADYLAFGPGAWGRDEKGRYEIAKDLKAYADNPAAARVYEENSDTERDFEAIMMGLRTRFGVAVQPWNERYRQDLLKAYEKVLQRWHPEHLQLDNGRLQPTEKGMEFLNEILIDFLETYEENH